MYFALFVLMTLIQCNFDVSKSELHTEGLGAYVIKLPPAVMQIRFGSFCCGQ
jgi:hypothetical protein